MKYDYEINFKDINSQPYNIVRLIQPKTKVLDIGCASGNLGKYLRNNLHCFVDGIDINPEYKSSCEKKLDNFYLMDLNNKSILESFLKRNNYDFIILADIVEHLINPEELLNMLSNTTNASIICSLPNISFWEARLKLLLGIFKYEDSGIFDKTHLHFYNLPYARKILSSKFNIADESHSSWYTPLEKLLHLREIAIVKDLACQLRRILTKIWPNFYASQIIFLLQPKRILPD